MISMEKKSTFRHKAFTIDSQIVVLLTISMLPITTSEVMDHFDLPTMPKTTYSQPGDIRIGSIVSILANSLNHRADTCSSNLKNITASIEIPESIAFAVNLVNSMPEILPNVTLGFIIRPTCDRGISVSLGSSFSFLLGNHRTNQDCTIEEKNLGIDCTYSDVIGLVGSGLSSHTLPISALYSVGQLPIIGTIESNDEFSNNLHHPFIFRLTQPTRYQVNAIFDFIQSNNWTYISVLHMDGFGVGNYFDIVEKTAHKQGICIATSHRIVTHPKYDEIVTDLLKYKARVVILFIHHSAFKEILQTVHDKHKTGHFIWVAASTMEGYTGHTYKGVDYDLAVGTFLINEKMSLRQTFRDHLESQNPLASKNPWLKPLWENFFDCSLQSGTCDMDVNIRQSKKYFEYHPASLSIDAVLIFAQAAHELLSKKCPKARGKEARACITGESLRQIMRTLRSVPSFGMTFDFDDHQDIKGMFDISQLVYDQSSNASTADKKLLQRKSIGFYKGATHQMLDRGFKDISWAHLSNVTSKTPISICSVPCGVGELKIEKESSCCWECRKCRTNERLVDDNTSCIACPPLMWPDPDSGFTTCIDIPLTYPVFGEPIPTLFTIFAAFGILVTIIVNVGYSKYLDERIIKASVRELSIIQHFGIFTGFLTVILFQTKPSDMVCVIIFIMFCMSFVLLYAPLLVMALKMWLDFRNPDNTENPSCTSPRRQIFFATCLVIIQGIACIIIYSLFRPGAKLTQRHVSENLVELSCDFTLPGIVSFLCYNIVLVSLCSVFAFVTRNGEFNQSSRMFMCIATTLLSWLSLMPAYFTANREYVRSFLLSVALYVNHSAALLFLFTSKIYKAMIKSQK